jgi:hypothetical protein
MTSKIIRSAMGMGAVVALSALSTAALAAKPISPDVPSEAEATVTADFPSAHNLHWAGEGEVYTAYFTEYRIRTIANVDADGQLLSVLKYYGPARLPEKVRERLDNKYPDRTIKSVTEYDVNSFDDPSDGLDATYSVTMEDAGHYYIVRTNGSDAWQEQVLDKE